MFVSNGRNRERQLATVSGAHQDSLSDLVARSAENGSTDSSVNAKGTALDQRDARRQRRDGPRMETFGWELNGCGYLRKAR